MIGQRGRRWLRSAVLVLAAAWGGIGLLRAGEPAAKKPVPDAGSLQRALALVQEVYGDEFKRAKDAAQKTALAEKILQKAKESATDPTSQYALLRVAKDIAALSGNAAVALRAAEDMALTFEVEVFPAKAETLLKAAQAASQPQQHAAIVAHAETLIEQAVRQDDFDVARSLSQTALAAAKKSGDSALVKKTVARAKEVDDTSSAYAQVKDSLAKLDNAPADPDANLAVGRYLCLTKGEWEKGLHMLALGNDPALKDLAVKELEGASDTNGQMGLGDGWWELASASEAAVQKQLQERAAYWYKKALPGLAGLAKQKVEVRLRELTPPESPPMSETATKTPRRPPRLAIAFDGTNSYITAPHISLDEYAAFTVEAWIHSWQNHLIDQGMPGDPENQFTIQRRAADVEVYWEFGRGQDFGRSPSVSPSSDWEHLAVVFDQGQLAVFINGKRVYSEAGCPKPGPFTKQDRPLALGANQVTSRVAPTARGLLRSLRISNAARYSAEFEPPQALTADANTCLLLDAEHGRGNTLLDQSGRGQHATAYCVTAVRAPPSRK
jgi:hypothetical protein